MSRASYAADLALVRASVRGRRTARHDLAVRLQCVARMLAARNGRSGRPLDDDELADVVQDSLAVIWSKRREYAGRAAIETWAYRISVLEWINALRAKQRRQGRRFRYLDEDGIAGSRESTASGERDPARAEEVLLVTEALARLGQPDGDVIRCKHFDDASFTEIGLMLDASPSTVKFWYYRGIERLRGWLAPLLDGDES